MHTHAKLQTWHGIANKARLCNAVGLDIVQIALHSVTQLPNRYETVLRLSQLARQYCVTETAHWTWEIFAAAMVGLMAACVQNMAACVQNIETVFGSL